ncbi:helix-turn-helix transcriptional regulator [Micromonospora sp. KC213]|uniref:helix-turn-helix domain-containing protein n=1 Tax=Micromonospora sp. KC213 TaxID=2530378 RepID=UPI00104C135F|nr:helix-turn-helix transcriptional regulator [Micromonospora sp. KC213]TDC36443.1 XRE family transcriptional regulator [Micromonospora sp. KC213]
MSLLRRVIGGVLRRVRQRQGRTLREVAQAAGVSLPYLSEVERGRKEASSEVLAAICRALGINLSDLLEEARDDLRRVERRVPTAPRVTLVRLDQAPAVRTDAGPRLRIGFHADLPTPEPRAATPVAGAASAPATRLLRLRGPAPTVGGLRSHVDRSFRSAGGRLPHVDTSGFGAVPPVAPPASCSAGLVGGTGLRVRLFAPVEHSGPRTPRVPARRRVRAGRQRLTVR